MKYLIAITICAALTSCEGLNVQGTIEGKSGAKYSYDGETLNVVLPTFTPSNSK